MPLYAAGQRIRASELNTLPQTYRVLTDQVCNNDASYRNANGLAFPGEVNGVYLIEGVICYRTGLTPGIKFQWSVPGGVTGWYGLQAVVGTPSGAGGRIAWMDSSSFVNDFTANFGANGDSTLAQILSPKGVAIFGATAGSMQFRYAQSTANASDTKILAGSCLRVTRLA